MGFMYIQICNECITLNANEILLAIFFSCSCFILLSYGLHAYIRKYFVAWKRERDVEDLFDLISDCQMRRKEKECAEKFILLGGPVIDEFSLFWGCDWMIEIVEFREGSILDTIGNIKNLTNSGCIDPFQF